MDLNNIGNLAYEHEPKKVMPAGLITSPSLVLKLYDLFTEQTKPNPIEETKTFLKKEILEKKINPLTGMGFAILSKDILNVARWDTKYPIVLKNQIYGYGFNNSDEMDNRNYTPIDYFDLDINKEGCFCIWELGIVNHEMKAWKAFLKSSRTESDKREYLESKIAGKL